MKAFENELAGGNKMTPDFKDGLSDKKNGQDVSFIAKFLNDDNEITQKYNTVEGSKSYSINRTILEEHDDVDDL